MKSSLLPRTRSIRVYARLAKLDVFDYYLAMPVVWTLVPTTDRLAVRVVATLVLFLLGAVWVLASAVSFDDVTGYRDGSDAANYGPDAPARRLARKPLLTGELTPREAIRFAWCGAAIGTVLWVLAIAIAPYRPAWAIVATLVCLFISIQYSYGLKLGYRGGQELILIGFGVGMVLAPAGCVVSHVNGLVLVEAVLFGLGPLLFGVYSNTNDVAGDAAVQRRTAAALLSPRGNAVLIAALSVSEPTLVLVVTVAGVAPWWLPVALLPTMVLRGRQLLVGLGHADVLSARRLGIHTHRTTAVALIVANLALGAIA